MRKFVCIKFIIFLVTIPLFAVEYWHTEDTTFVYGGHIEENTVWHSGLSPYFVFDDIVVDSGATLWVDPGVEVILDHSFSNICYIKVHGGLIIEGTPADTVRFFPMPDGVGAWSGIIFERAETAYVAYAWFSSAWITLDFDSCKGLVENCYIQGRSDAFHGCYAAIYSWWSNVKIENSYIYGRSWDYHGIDRGVVVDTGSVCEVENCVLYDHSYSWKLYPEASFSIKNSLMYSTTGSWLYEGGVSQEIVEYNLFVRNSTTIYHDSESICSLSVISNNTFAQIYEAFASMGFSNSSLISSNLISYTDYAICTPYDSFMLPWYTNVFAAEDTDYYCIGSDSLGILAMTNYNGDSCDIFYNISLDPQFVDTTAEDFYLQYTSPCIDAGDPSLPWDPDGTRPDIGAFYFDQTGIYETDKPSAFKINLYPNPFNSVLNIEFGVDKELGFLTGATIFDLNGREIKRIPLTQSGAGLHGIWDATDDSNNPIQSGVYLCVLNIGTWSVSRKVILIR